MRRVAGERNPAEGPAFDGVLVHHRVFENAVGRADQFAYIKPVEPERFEDREEIVRRARLVPVVGRARIVFDFGNPVDQLRSPAVHIVGQRIDHDLAGVDRPDAQICPAVEDRRPDRQAAPCVDAGEHDLFGRIVFFAHRRIHTVAGDGCIGAQIGQGAVVGQSPRPHHDAAVILFAIDHLAIVDDRVRPHTRDHCLVQDRMQAAPVDADFGKGVVREPAAWFCKDALPEPVAERALAIFNAARDNVVRQAERIDFAHGVRQQRDAGPDVAIFRCGFENRAADLPGVQAKRQRQPDDPAADYCNMHALVSFLINNADV